MSQKQQRSLKGNYKNIVDFKRMWERDVIRVHCVPHNPRTFQQQKNRFRFRFVSRVGSGSLVNVVRPYWNNFDPFNMGFNTFVKVNMFQVGQDLEFSNILMTIGNFEPVNSITFIKYKDVNGRAMFKWSTVITGKGQPTDTMILILLDWRKYELSNYTYPIDCYINTDKIRSDSVGFIMPPKELDVDFLEGYIGVTSGGLVGDDTMSISKYKKVISF